MKVFKTICGFGFLLVLASNIWTISRWSESRGVYDDVCYLRQAHLFQQFGLDGLNTDIARDGDNYLANKLKEINFPNWNDPAGIPCHTLIASANKYVMQYPPGTGFALSLFPSGFQVIPLYALANITIFGFALLRIVQGARAGLARTCHFVRLCRDLPDDQSCQSELFGGADHDGLRACRLSHRQVFRGHAAVSACSDRIGGPAAWPFRQFPLAEPAPVGGIFSVPRRRVHAGAHQEAFLQAVCFGAGFLIGMAPTLIANAINAGSPFATTYGAVDTLPPELNAGILWRYFVDIQFTLLAIAAGWTVWVWRFDQGRAKQIAILVA